MNDQDVAIISGVGSILLAGLLFWMQYKVFRYAARTADAVERAVLLLERLVGEE